ncbi:DNA polymerase III subunit delta, partial [Flavobacteriaceae bacterium]|nr:DNA polymerase III subunit delta [Flavobacteriaceae bacterium]
VPFKIDNFINNIDQNKEVCCVVIFGKDPDLISLRAKKISIKIIKDDKDPFVKCFIDDKKIEEEVKIADEFYAISMMGGRKLIVINSIKSDTKVCDQLQNIFAQKISQNSNFILITCGDLATSSKLRKFAESNDNIAAIACYEESERDLLQFIKAEFRQKEIIINNNLAELILSRIGNSRMEISNEIEKIFLYLDGSKIITKEVIFAVISDLKQDDINDFTNHFMDLNLQEAIKNLHNLFVNKVNAIFIIRALANYLYKIYQTKIGLLQGGSMESEIRKQRIFFMQKSAFIRHNNLWSQRMVNNILLELQNLEIKFKSGVMLNEVILLNFINLVCLKFRK